MRRSSMRHAASAAALLALVVTVSGCGGSSSTTERTARRTAPAVTKAELAEAARASAAPVTRLRTILGGTAAGGTAARQALAAPAAEIGAQLDTFINRLGDAPPDLQGAEQLRSALDGYRRLVTTLNGPAAGADPATARELLPQLDAEWARAIAAVEQTTGTTVLPPGLLPPLG
ncbi:MAG: hypothetical protein ACOYOQ_13345 [Microthrixaceae bacterium]